MYMINMIYIYIYIYIKLNNRIYSNVIMYSYINVDLIHVNLMLICIELSEM